MPDWLDARCRSDEVASGREMKQQVATRDDMTGGRQRLACLGGIERRYPARLIRSLREVARRDGIELYLVGGCVRDWLLGRAPHDLDLAVPRDAVRFCRQLIATLGGGTLVQLGTDGEEAARVVWQGWDVDVAVFRGGSGRIEDDLRLRDFSINSLAVAFGTEQGEGRELIDPLGGLAHLDDRLVHGNDDAFVADPLRLLRAFRFAAVLGFVISSETLAAIGCHAEAIGKVAAERISYELDLIMQSSRAATAMTSMHEAGLLRQIIGELYAGEGVRQPGFHHLDVFHHNLQTLQEMEGLLGRAAAVFPCQSREVDAYLAGRGASVRLKWAALLHDLGKPEAEGEAGGPSGRITFHGHDEIGRKQVDTLARRLKWSNDQREGVAHLVGMHMHPFHLCTARRDRPLTRRAALKLCRRAGDDLPGLFLLAMADSLAGCGEFKPPTMEQDLGDLYDEVAAVWRNHVQPALAGPPLVTGRDLISIFGLEPGPVFSTILDELLAQQVEGKVTTREDALAWVASFVK